MKRYSTKDLDKMESKLLKQGLTKDIDVELAQEYMMVDLYSGYSPGETQNGVSGFPLQETRNQANPNVELDTENV